MLDDQSLTQKPIPEENPIPASPQEPMADISINTMGSEPSNIPPEAPESPKNADIPFSLNSDNHQNSPISTPTPEEVKPAESGIAKAENPKAEPISEPVQTSETRTAQIPVNEPLASESEVKSEPLKPEPQTFSQPKISLARELLIKARNAIQFRKRKKLDRVMTLFLKKSKITNDEVREFLHVSDTTATRYLSILEKEGRIKQNGKTGHSVFYSKI